MAAVDSASVAPSSKMMRSKTMPTRSISKPTRSMSTPTISTIKSRMPSMKQNSVVRAVNSFMPAIKLDAEDILPDSSAAKAIADMTKELEASVKTFTSWESQLGKYSGPEEWDNVVRGVRAMQEDAEAALQASRQLRMNQKHFASAMMKLLQKSQYNSTQRLLDGSAELLLVGEQIAEQSNSLQQHVAGMREKAQQLSGDIEVAKVASKKAPKSWSQTLAKSVKAIFRACSIMLTALAAVLPAVPSVGVPAALLAGTSGAISGGIADGAEQIEKYYNRTLKKEILLTSAAQEVKGVILRLSTFPAMQRVLEAEMALQSGRVVRMRSGGELNRATEAWRLHMAEF
ncbi:hypothetical protein BKA62DRAFT_700638 [Auriculariales sp. MPI-PUGE-AT-0066]|nr:hypothetical protein BKA62DRAFT_700638 [Auriculariales sp. MPI-PUGE-AT-0066]